MTQNQTQIPIEQLGPAERVINSLITHADHLYHGRPGLVTKSTGVTGVAWEPVSTKTENGVTTVFKLIKNGKKNTRVAVGTLNANKKVVTATGNVLGEFRDSGIFPEVAAYLYGQVAEVWKLNNEFAAHWASYTFAQDHRDLKVVLAAFMLVQSRKGDPVLEDGKVIFNDDDFRDVGEAMFLLSSKDKKDFNPKMLVRTRELLSLPQIAKINFDLGFSKSDRKPFLGRWNRAVEKWLRYREENPKALEGLVKAGFKKTVMDLCRAVGYKPNSPKFFEILRWKQAQAKSGHRSMALGQVFSAAETWEDLSEQQICEKIVQSKPSWKIIVSQVPRKIGITRAIMTAAIESNCLSDKDLIIVAPTLEDLGLLQVQNVAARFERAVKNAEDMRAANIAANVKTKAVKDKLEEAADNAVKKSVAEAMKDVRVYFMVDISGSMDNAISSAKDYISMFLQAFPPDKVHVSVFNTVGTEVKIKHASKTGVSEAFKGIHAGGGTDYAAGVRALKHYKPLPGEDVLFFFVGDEDANVFFNQITDAGFSPSAFAFLKVKKNNYDAVQRTAYCLKIPCFMVEPETFKDIHSIPRTISNLIASTPVKLPNGQGQVQATKRVSLIETIVNTKLLQKPAWALNRRNGGEV